MKYHRLHIHFEKSFETYNAVIQIMGQKPTEFPPSRFDSDIPNDWTLQVIEDNDKDPYFDFIKYFLDLLETKFDALENLGIKRNDILIWLNYEYYSQCSMSFSPDEMKRLGESGIALNIDCFKKRDKDNPPI